jgi:hypothetical protein
LVAVHFDEYETKIFLKYIEEQLKNADRLDLVFDTYPPNSLKASNRERRDTPGNRRHVTGNAPLPKDWSKFLRVDALMGTRQNYSFSLETWS